MDSSFNKHIRLEASRANSAARMASLALRDAEVLGHGGESASGSRCGEDVIGGSVGADTAEAAVTSSLPDAFKALAGPWFFGGGKFSRPCKKAGTGGFLGDGERGGCHAEEGAVNDCF